MKSALEVHPIQTKIIRVLLFNPEAKFAKLNADHVSSDQFSFHLKALVDSGLLIKIGKNYELTPTGKEFGNRLDTEQPTVQLEKQAKVSVLVVCTKPSPRGQVFLIQKRLKQPYFGFHGFPGGKVKLGETLYEAAERELMEEVGLTGQLKITGYRHKMDYSPEGNLLEDKNFFVFRATNLKGKYQEKFEGGQNIWLTEKEILALPKIFDAVGETIIFAKSRKLSFIEKKYIVSGF